MSREKVIAVRLVDTVKAKLQREADRSGMKLATYCAMVLGKHCAEIGRRDDAIVAATIASEHWSKS